MFCDERVSVVCMVNDKLTYIVFGGCQHLILAQGLEVSFNGQH